MSDSKTIEVSKFSGECITIQKNRIVAVAKCANRIGLSCQIHLLASEQPFGVQESYEDVVCMVWG